MPIEFTPEEKTKVDAHLKELGYDEHAQKVIEKRNAEAKINRERAETAEAKAREIEDKVKALEAKEAEREKADKKAKEEAAAKLKEAEDAKKTELEKAFEKRMADLEEAMERKLTAKEKKDAQKQEELLGELKKRDAKILMQAVKHAATKAGILDDSIVSLLDLKDVQLEDGEPDVAKIEELIAAHKEAKPHLYRDEDDEEDTSRHREVERPPAKKGKDKGPDFGKMTDKEFAEAEAKLRVSR